MSATGANPPLQWFQSQPDRLKWELEQFAARGLPASQRMGLRDGRLPERLVVETELQFQGEPVPVEVVYPFEYPDAPPLVFGPPYLLDRHQNPRSGNFCWGEDPEREWSPRLDAAHLVAEDVRWLLADSERGGAVVRAAEADMPEPLTGLITLDPTCAVVVPDPYFAKQLPAAEGTMTLVGKSRRLFLAHAAGLGASSTQLRDRYFSNQPEHAGYWVELSPAPAPAVWDDDTLLVGAINSASRRPYGRLGSRLKKSKGLSVADCWLGITFLEEGRLRGEQRRNWVFACISKHSTGAERIGPRFGAQALTLAERRARTPELVGLADARVLCVGAGSLGAPVAEELVKAGIGQLDLLDPDTYDVNNAVRHVLSPAAAGYPKAEATAIHVGNLNPFGDVCAHVLRVGDRAQDAAALAQLIADADVVIDTTGSNSVSRILQRRCTEASKPLVVGGLSAGSYGGEVAVFYPQGACFDCLLLAQRDHLVPEPDEAPRTSLITPVGCSHPAFAGAGFDATQHAALIARTVVQVTGKSGYPAADFDWVITNFRRAPRWRSGRLEKHPECERCRA